MDSGSGHCDNGGTYLAFAEDVMFENIAIGIRTFLRDDHMYNAVQGIRTNLPGAKIIIADCGEMVEQKDGFYADLERGGHKHIDLPFDSGFGAMSNAIVDALDRPYLLVGSDDFDFSPIEVREGIEKLLSVLDLDSDVDIASGRVNNQPYEFDLIEKDGVVTEKLVNSTLRGITPWFVECDLTVNYSLIRKGVFRKVRWDDDVKIGGGEHGSFFVDCKRAGFRTVYVPGVNVNEQQVRNSPRYNLYRRRALDLTRPCFQKRGILKYVMGNGVTDYEE